MSVSDAMASRESHGHKCGSRKTDSFPLLQVDENDWTVASSSSMPVARWDSASSTAPFVNDLSFAGEGRLGKMYITPSSHGRNRIGAGHPEHAEATLCENSWENLGTKEQSHARSNGANADFARGGAIGGFNADLFLCELDTKYLCSVCLQVLREPVQTNCGHRFCESCIEQLR